MEEGGGGGGGGDGGGDKELGGRATDEVEGIEEDESFTPKIPLE